MLFKKQKQSTWDIEKDTGKLYVSEGSIVERQIKMIGLTPRDLDIIHALQPFVKEKLDSIASNFYQNLEHEPSLLKIINDNSSTDRLKKTLKQHILEMFSGIIDEEFLVKRKRIAYIHVKIGLPTKWYMVAF